MSDVFISYCREDRELVQRLAGGLEDRDLSLWWDEELKRGTRPWRDEIAEAISGSRSLLVVLTESSVCRREIQREVQLAETYRKPIIPLRVGDFPLESVVSGLIQLICIYNYVPVPGTAITAEVLDEIHGRLTAAEAEPAAEEAAPFHHLPPLAIEEADIPEVGTGRGKAILDACLEFFARQALDGGWRRAGQILEDMKNYQVLPARMSEYHHLGEWLGWVRWYDEVRDSCRTWPEVVASLRKHLSARPAGASSLETACAVVRERLREGWSRVFADRCVELHNCLYHFGPRDGSYAYTFPYLDILRADLLEPVAEALGEPFGCGREDAGRLIEDAKRVLGALGPGTEGPAAVWGRLRGHAFPPAGEELDRWRDAQEAARQQQGAGSRFLGFLERHATAADEAPVAELLDRVKTAGERLKPSAEVPDADSEVPPAAAAWERGLEGLFSAPADPEATAAAVEELKQASRLFPAAEAHARHARAWRDRLRDHEAWLDACERGDVDPGAAAAIDGLARPLRSLLRKVASPYSRHLGDVAGGSERRQRVREWIRCCELRLAEELPVESAQVGVLLALREGRSADAAKQIGVLEREHSEILADAGPWRELCEAMARVNELLAESAIPVGADGRRLPEAGPEWLEGDLDRVGEIRDRLDEVARLAAAIRLGRCRGRPELLPQLDALRESLSWVEDCMASWRRIKARLSQRDLEGALDSAAKLAQHVPPAGDLHDGLTRLRRVEERLDDLHEQKAEHRWTAAAEGIEKLRGELDGIQQGFGADELARVADLRRDELERELGECRLAENHEERLRQALGLIAGGQLEAARSLFEEMNSPLAWVASWQRAAGALEELQAALKEGADVQLLAAKVDARTGLPPEEQTLERERVRMGRIQELAASADEALAAARRSGPFDCDVDLPASTLQDLEEAEKELAGLASYQRLAQAVRGHTEEGRWREAIRMVEDFLGGADSTGLDDPAFRLLGALRIGRQAQEIRDANFSDERRYAELRGLRLHHPLLSGHLRYLRRLEGPLRARFSILRRAAERLCSLDEPASASELLARLLDVAVPADPNGLASLERGLEASPRELDEAPPPAPRLRRLISELEQAAGPNLGALGAMRGEVEEAAAAARATPGGAEKVHALAGAVFCQLRERRKPPASDTLAAALGVCALLACDESFRQSLLGPLGCLRAPAHSGNEPGIRERLTSEIEIRFSNGHVPWGEPADPESWAFRWQLECGAVRQLRAADPGPLPAPYGPSLIRFLGLERALHTAVAGSSKRRRWFGPCAVAVTLRHLEKYEHALDLLSQIARRRALEHEPGYMHLEDPAATLREDVREVRCGVRTSMINRDQLAATSGAGGVSEEPLGRLAEHCQDVLDQLERMDAPSEAFGSFSRTLQAFFKRMEMQIEQPGLYLGRPATVEDGEVRKRCMDQIIELFETRLGKWQRRRRPSKVQTELLGKLKPCLGYFHRTRSGLLVDFVHLKFLCWAQAHEENAPRGEAQAGLAELNELAKQCVHDAPGEPAAHMTQAQIKVLTAVVERNRDGLDEEIETYLDDLMTRAQGWPPNIQHGLKEMLEWVRGAAGNFASWLREQRGVKL